MGKVNVGVSVIVVQGDKILLGKRAEKGELGELSWNIPGGKLEEGENIRDAAIRELLEETGIRVSREKLELVGIIESKITKHYLSFVFFVKVNNARPKEGREVFEWRWFPLSRLPTELYPPTRDALELYKEYIAGKRPIVHLL